MPAWLVAVLAVAVFAVVGTWLARRWFDAPLTWTRGIVVSVLVVVAAAPGVLWVMTEAQVVKDDRLIVDDLVAAWFLVLITAWVLAIIMAVLTVLELLFPSRGARNPVVVMREWVARQRRARRFAKIASIASRHGLGGLWSSRGSPADWAPAALVAAINDAGVTFVKAGQLLSTRADLLPPEFVAALETLQMDSTPIPWAEARGAIEAQLRRPIEEVFAEIDEEPLAAASVGQVHAARLMDGSSVVVKIQRPRARAEVATDLDILERLAGDLERRAGWAEQMGVRSIAGGFATALREELDYRVEVANMALMRSAAAYDDRLRIPVVHAELCTEQMIVMERVEGIPFSRLAGGAHGLDADEARAIADSILDAVFSQIAIRGIFHGDLHPGNLILASDGGVSLIDFGSIGVLERSLRRLLLPMLIAIGNDDDSSATDVTLLLATPKGDADLDIATLQHDIGVVLTRVRNSGIDEGVFSSVLDVMRRHRLAVPPGLLLAFRTLGALEGSLRHLVPGYDMTSRALERAPSYVHELGSFRSAALTAEVQWQVGMERMRTLPRRLDGVLGSLEQGTLSLRLKTFESPSERSWIQSLAAQGILTVIGVSLMAIGILLGLANDGPMLTGDVPAYPFLGSVVGLSGLLLVLRVLQGALRRSGPGR
ncbi:ABC1 kinase family protein [Agromyces sp. NPDC058110]|uniref:ABC1 kinase family protein n=1 Tax=Agromyces sp. NPDC058110 TaxID=3346345 RepID=UPI0036DFA09E